MSRCERSPPAAGPRRHLHRSTPWRWPGWATEREAAGASVIHLEVGQPSSPAPAAVREAATRALEQDQIGYTNAPGLLSLREAIAGHYLDWYGVDVDPAQIVVTAGASAGFTLAFLACFDPGQRVGVVEPGYPCYRNTLLALGVEPVAIPVGPEHAVGADARGGRGRGSARRPGGGQPVEPDRHRAAGRAPRRPRRLVPGRGVQLVSDEIYHGIAYGQRAETALALDRGAVVVSSFSKYFSMTGWRLGWITAPPVPDGRRRALPAEPLHLRADAVPARRRRRLRAAPTSSTATWPATPPTAGSCSTASPPPALTDRAAADGAFYVYADVSHLTDDSLGLCAGAGWTRRASPPRRASTSTSCGATASCASPTPAVARTSPRAAVGWQPGRLTLLAGRTPETL